MKVTVIGGSNSLLKHGYVSVFLETLRNKTQRDIEINNLAIGNTFSHFGFWQTITKGGHQNSDVIIVEYALNDQELVASKLFNQWASVYEGLIAKLRRESPFAQIISPLFMTRRAVQNQKIMTLISGAAFINLRYNVENIDATQEIYSLGGADYWEPEKDWYKDGPHYNKNIQAIIGVKVAEKVISGAGRAFARDYFPVSIDYLNEPKSAIKEGDFDKLFSGAERFQNHKNSIVNERSAVFSKNNYFSFLIKGKLLALIVISTRNDGVVKIEVDGKCAYASLRRKIFDKDQTKFLLNILIPDQYFKENIPESLDFKLFKFSVVEDLEPIADEIVCRGSARVPDKDNHTFEIVDIFYDGDIKSDS